eukprot:767779-Hanusia_phi.AAC.7
MPWALTFGSIRGVLEEGCPRLVLHNRLREMEFHELGIDVGYASLTAEPLAHYFVTVALVQATLLLSVDMRRAGRRALPRRKYLEAGSIVAFN